MTPALQRLAQFFDTGAHLVQSVAAASPDRAAVSDAALRQALSRLSREECEDFLFRLAQGEAGLSRSLRHRLQSELKRPRKPATGRQRTVTELLETAQQLKREEVEAPLQHRHASAYDQAVAQLKQLRDLADYKNTRAEFNRRMRQLSER